ncbi:MAG: hypothetical protein R2706_00165 [Acidimicrobiales bacterium]
MTSIQTSHRVSAAQLEQLHQPRTDILIEVASGPSSWEQSVGPFTTTASA